VGGAGRAGGGGLHGGFLGHLKVFPKLGLSSAGPQGGEVVYDLQKILTEWTKDSIVVLTYEGGGDVGHQHRAQP